MFFFSSFAKLTIEHYGRNMALLKEMSVKNNADIIRLKGEISYDE